jgi:hypothetical protein
MSKLHDTWDVGPHGPLEAVDDGLLSVEGEIVMPLGRFPRRMTVVGLRNGRTAIWSPVPLREPEMERIEALGAPAFLIVPGIAHRLDIRPWKRRYPSARILCPRGARAAVDEAVPVDATHDILDDPTADFLTVPGVGEREAAMLVRRGDRLTLVVNDILANVRHPHGIGARIMATLLGFGMRRPRMPRIGRRMFVDDAKVLAATFRHWADEPDLARIIVSHGDVISDYPRTALRQAAADFG